MRATYDPTADAVSLELVPGAARARTLRVDAGTLLHYDRQKRLIELELLGASGRYERAALEEMASPAEYLTLLAAAKESGLSPVTLRQQLQKGRLAGMKQGRDWMVSRAALLTYLDNREASGRPPRSRKARRARKRVHQAV